MKFKPIYETSPFVKLLSTVVIISFVSIIVYPVSTSNIYLITLCFIFSVIILSELYMRYAPKKLYLDIEEPMARNYPNENQVFHLIIKQNGWLPIFGGTMKIRAGDDIKFSTDKVNRTSHYTETSIHFSVMPKRKKRIEIPFRTIERGVSHVFNCELEIENLFAINHFSLSQLGQTAFHVIVYPNVKKVHDPNLNIKLMDGLYQNQNALFYDPMLKLGVRDYEVNDSPKRINWKQSARFHEMKTNVYENTTHVETFILVNLRSDKSYVSPQYIETIYEKISYIAYQFTEESIPYALYSNIKTLDERNFLHLKSNNSMTHYKNTLELLARLTAIDFTVPFDVLIDYVYQKESLPTHIIFTGKLDDDIQKALLKFDKIGVDIYQLDQGEIIPFRQAVIS